MIRRCTNPKDSHYASYALRAVPGVMPGRDGKAGPLIELES